MCYSSGQARGTLSCSHISLTPGKSWRVFFVKYLLKKEKFFEKTGEQPSVTGGLRTGDSKKFESIRINLRDLAWSQVFPRDPGVLKPWIPGTSPGTTPGIPSIPTLLKSLSGDAEVLPDHPGQSRVTSCSRIFFFPAKCLCVTPCHTKTNPPPPRSV